MRPKRFTSSEELCLAAQWEEVRAEYLASNQRTAEANEARAKAEVFRNQLQDNCDE